MSSFFRYPGGKSKLSNFILKHLDVYYKNNDLEYREPFFGGGSIGLKFISSNPQWKKIWINDKDVGISDLWTSVIQYPQELKYLVKNFSPSVELFGIYKKELLEHNDTYIEKDKIVQRGFKKLALHQISYSGLGTKSGGPLGGKEQKSKYKIDCRWSPDYICKKIDKLHTLFSKLEIKNNKCTSLDFEELIKCPGNCFLYLDPPYYIKGNELYQNGFTKDDHNRLADLLKSTEHPWILSYDDCEEIRSLYNWAKIKSTAVNYTITAEKVSGKCYSRNKFELLICSPNHKEVDDDSCR